MEGWDTHKPHMVIVNDRDSLASKIFDRVVTWMCVYQSILDTCRPIINIFTLSFGEEGVDVGSMRERGAGIWGL